MSDELRSLCLFEGVDEAILKKVRDFGKIKTYPKDFALFYEGEIIEQALFLLDGVVSLCKFDRFGNRKYLYSTHSTQKDKDEFLLINEISFGKIKTFANAFVQQTSKILSIELKEFLELAKQNQTLFSNLTKQLILQDQRFKNIIDRELVFDTMARLAYVLDKNLYRFNTVQHQEIAYRLNIRPETLSRTLKKFKEDNIIDADASGNITIIDRIKLRSIYLF